ncbi:MAG TPA: hypothetical protein DCF33_16865, partial [Saprospirales bacterium]|nr:hypothetical protein [Saprospirales bacterium]
MLLPVFLCSILSAQESGFSADSTQSKILPELTIRHQTLEKVGYAVWKPDSLPQASAYTLAERLLWEHHFDVRTNGPGLLTTFSLRGSGATRTPVFWNGLNLQSPMNGVMDASLMSL